MDFWLRYADSMEEVWLALGSNSRCNPHKDYMRIRREMEGRWMELDGPSYQADNAFMMKIGGLLFIEFAKPNNACHVFDARDMPFRLGQRSVLGTKEGLKNSQHRGHRGTWRHNEGWQSGFEGGLKRHAGASPVDVARQNRSRGPVVVKASADTSSSKSSTTSSLPPLEGFDLRNLQSLCSAYGVNLEDRRALGGELRVLVDDKNPYLARILRLNGFQYGEGRWWREED